MGRQKNTKNRCKKRKGKMEAQSKKSRGVNLNPLAPAQSKRTSTFSGETRNCIGNASISAPFFSPFCTFFEPFQEKSSKGSMVWPQSYKNTPKWTPRAPRRSPRITKLSTKVQRSTTNMQNKQPRMARWGPKCYN